MTEATTTIDRYGVMGYPISHSRSPVIHRLFALQTGQDMQYELLQVSPEKLETAVRQFQRTIHLQAGGFRRTIKQVVSQWTGK